MTLLLLSTPKCAFIPKYHWFPFRVWCIPGSRSFAAFLVELGALMMPGIGVVSVLAYVSTVEDPERFTRSRSVGAHMGLTPRQYQSGEIDRSGRISRCGDTLARTLMYEAAVVILTRVKRASNLKDWAQAIAKRSGLGKARVALARKLSVILHSIGRSGEAFRWSEQPAGS